MSNIADKEETVSPATPKEMLLEAIEVGDEKQIAEIVESNTSQETLRQASLMNAVERDQLISTLAPEAAAELIEEAPAGLAASMIEGLDTTVAAKIMEELRFQPVDATHWLNRTAGVS